MGEATRAVRHGGAALLALGLVFASPASADPGCSVHDLLNDTLTAITGFPASCLGNPMWIPVLPFAIAAVQAAQAGAPNFCNAAEIASNPLGEGNTLLQKLQSLGVSADEISAISSIVSDAADAANFVSCACKVAQDSGLASLGQDILDCLNDLFCDVEADVSCPCTPKPVLVPINCAQNPCPPGSMDWFDNCTAPGGIWEDKGAGTLQFAPVTCSTTSAGEVCLQSQGSNGCDKQFISECVCPSPMSLVEHCATTVAGATCQNPQGPVYYYLMCECPSGTKAAGMQGTQAYTCLCPSGQQVNSDGSCPPVFTPGPCPGDQQLVGGNCVSSCSNTQVLLADGSCCDPAQVAACGLCCPAGQRPDSDTGGCEPVRSPPVPPRR